MFEITTCCLFTCCFVIFCRHYLHVFWHQTFAARTCIFQFFCMAWKHNTVTLFKSLWLEACYILVSWCLSWCHYFANQSMSPTLQLILGYGISSCRWFTLFHLYFPICASYVTVFCYSVQQLYRERQIITLEKDLQPYISIIPATPLRTDNFENLSLKLPHLTLAVLRNMD